MRTAYFNNQARTNVTDSQNEIILHGLHESLNGVNDCIALMHATIELHGHIPASCEQQTVKYFQKSANAFLCNVHLIRLLN